MTRWSRVNDLFHAGLLVQMPTAMCFLPPSAVQTWRFATTSSRCSRHMTRTQCRRSRSLVAVGTHVGGYEITGLWPPARWARCIVRATRSWAATLR